MNVDKLKAELINDEGLVLHAYKDSLGYITIGVGRLIDPRKGGGLTEEESLYLLENDIASKANELRRLWPAWDSLDDARKRATLNMAFQLGPAGLMKFKNMIRAIEAGDWVLAHAEALDSTWAGQTPARAKRVAGMILTGGAHA